MKLHGLSPAELFDNVTILCVITMTSEPNPTTKPIHVKNTWERRCEKLIFASSVTDVAFGSLKFQGEDRYEY